MFKQCPLFRINSLPEWSKHRSHFRPFFIQIVFWTFLRDPYYRGCSSTCCNMRRLDRRCVGHITIHVHLMGSNHIATPHNTRMSAALLPIGLYIINVRQWIDRDPKHSSIVSRRSCFRAIHLAFSSGHCLHAFIYIYDYNILFWCFTTLFQFRACFLW